MPHTAPPPLQEEQGMWFYRDPETDQDTWLGFLLILPDKGPYDATFGRVSLSAEQAERHNDLLSAGQILGLDENCAIGQGGTFYLNNERTAVRTWIGAEVSRDLTWRGQVLTFRRQGKTFRGRVRKGEDVFHFTRIT